MTSQRKKVAAEYCGVYLAGSRDVDVPTDWEKVAIHASRDCLNIPCLAGQFGEAEVVMGEALEIAPASPPDFDGSIRTPFRSVLLFDANDDRIMEAPVSDTQTRVRVWINHPREPDRITIALG